MAGILHEEIYSSLNFRVQSCPRVGGGGGGGAVAPPAPFSSTTGLMWSECEGVHVHQTM